MRPFTLLMLGYVACAVACESLAADGEAPQQPKPARSPSTDRANRARLLDGFSLAQASSLYDALHEASFVDYEALIAAEWQAHDRQSQLQKKYPIESLRSRLAYEEHSPAYTTDLQQRPIKPLGGNINPRGLTWRAEGLRRLHQATAEEFISRPGFGFGRHPGPRAEELLLVEPVGPLAVDSPPAGSVALGPDAPLKLSDSQFPPAVFAGRAPTKQLLYGFNVQSKGIFASESWLGYAESLDHVTGFVPHQFWKKPELGTRWPGAWDRNDEDWKSQRLRFDRWRNTRLQLVSLLKHPEPRVYVSENLPAMTELKDAETRALNDFEQAALSKLRPPNLNGSNDVVIEATTNTIRMMGPLRTEGSCSDCHQVKAGHLLGAFSYVFERDPPISAAAAAQYVDDTSAKLVRKQPLLQLAPPEPSPLRRSPLQRSPLQPFPPEPSPLQSFPTEPSPLKPSPLEPSPLQPQRR